MVYVVVDIGCLECGNPTRVLGVYDDLERAEVEHPDASFVVRLGEDADECGKWWGTYLKVIFEAERR